MIEPYYQEDGITLYCAKAEDVLPQLDDDGIDCVIIDPPYNIGYKYDNYNDSMDEDEYFYWQIEIVRRCEWILKRGGSLFYLHYPEFAARMFWEIPAACDLQQVEWINWIYNTHTSGDPLRKASRAWLWLAKEMPLINYDALSGEYKNQNDVRVRRLIEVGKLPRDYDWWQVEQVKNVSKEKTEHPCQLPCSMLAKLIKATTNKLMTILDPFAGSGTTLVAAKRLGRKAIGIEISEKYCEIAVKRLSQKELFGVE